MEGVSGPDGFDAELYLRLTGERALLAGEGSGPPTPPLLAAAHALVAIGALPAETARAVVDDYLLAGACREGPGQVPPGRPAPDSRSAVDWPSAVPCGRVIKQPWGQLRIEFILLRDEATALDVRLRPPPSPPPPGPERSYAFGWQIYPSPAGLTSTFGSGFPGTLTLVDDHGTVTDAQFTGGGNDGGWSGRYVTQHPLARDAAWVEVLGERVGLTSRAAAVRVRTERLAEPDPARRYLRAVLASASVMEDVPVPATLATLIAAGALADGDPEIAATHAVLNWRSEGLGGRPGSAALHEPWRSLRPPGWDGPTGLVVVGAVTPEFDGITVAVLAVESTEEEFSIAVEAAPDVPMSLGQVDDPVLAWWAVDDRGHYYLGEPGDWRWSDERGRGRIDFSVPLDPAATMLDLVPTTPAARAIITIPLDWAG